MRHFLLIICSTLLFLSGIQAQWLVSTNLETSMTQAELSQLAGVPAQYGVDVYSVKYMTPNLAGEQHEASGLFVIPKTDDSSLFPVLCYQHGTVGSRDDVPSRLQGGYELGLVFGAMGFVTVMPDYVGLGDSPGIHPYIHADTEASAGADLIRAVREFPDFPAGSGVHEQIFISGYSQGGHASMALHKLLESDLTGEMEVTAAAHSSGPYSVSDKMVQFTLSDTDYFTPAYIAWVSLSMKAAYPEELIDFGIENVFKPEFVDDVNRFANEEITLWDLNTIMIAQLFQETEHVRPKDMLLPGIVDAFLNDSTHPLTAALAKQDNYDWTPQAGTRIYYCTADDQVTFENAIVADEMMQANGAPDVIALNQGEDLDHGGCVVPATTSTLFYFLGLRRIDQVLSDEDLEAPQDYLLASEVDGQLFVMVNPDIMTGSDLQLSIMNANGKLMQQHDVLDDTFTLDASSFTSGVYVLCLLKENRIVETLKFFKK